MRIVDGFLYSCLQTVWQCRDIVRRNYVLVTRLDGLTILGLMVTKGSQELFTLYPQYSMLPYSPYAVALIKIYYLVRLEKS